jgi:hypothetical protein
MTSYSEAQNPTAQRDAQDTGSAREWEGDFELIEFAGAPEPMVAAHIPMQED